MNQNCSNLLSGIVCSLQWILYWLSTLDVDYCADVPDFLRLFKTYSLNWKHPSSLMM